MCLDHVNINLHQCPQYQCPSINVSINTHHPTTKVRKEIPSLDEINNIWDQIFEDFVIAWRKNPFNEFEFDPKNEKNDYLRALCPKQLWQRRRRWEGQLLVGGWNNKQASDVSDKLVKNIYIFFNFLVYFRPVHQTLFAQKNYGNQCTIYFLCFAFNRWFWRDVSEGPSSCIDKGTLCCVRHILREPHAQIRNMIYNIRVA